MATTTRRSSWGLGSLPGLDWRQQALCRHDPDLFTTAWRDGPGRARAGQAIHVCLRHCPVLADCEALAAQERPRGIVQAGQRWPVDKRNGGGPKPLDDPGCGPWCARVVAGAA